MKATFKLVSLSLLLSFMTAGVSVAQNAEYGDASYYNDKYHNQSTASGELYDKNAMTAAHKSLAFGTRVRVTRLDNNKSVVVRINDRGPYKPGRIIDLSRKAAEKIDLISDGVTNVKVEILNKEDEKDLVATKTTKTKETPKPKAKTKVSATKPKPTKVSQKSKSKPAKYTDGNGFMNGYYKVSLERVDSSFGVQVGTFTNYEYMMNQVAQLHNQWFSDVIVSIGTKEGRKVYKVIVGSLDSREAADEYRKNVLKKTGIKGFVVALEN